MTTRSRAGNFHERRDDVAGYYFCPVIPEKL